MAPAGEEPLKGVQDVLPAGNFRIVTPTVFETDKRAVGSEHATHLAQRTKRIGDRAKRPSADDTIELLILPRLGFGA